MLGRKEHGNRSEKQIKRLSSVGRPFPGQEIIVCDEQGHQVANGSHGELWIRGLNTICGYYRSDDLTRENFSPDGFWKSGDIGYVDDDGYIYLVERKKDLIISGGYNVYATEVENCLNAHEAVQNAAVVGLPDEQWGEAVCAVVILAAGHSVSGNQLIDYCKQKLSRFKAPKKVIIRNELPLNSVGKVIRRKLRDQLIRQGKSSVQPSPGAR